MSPIVTKSQWIKIIKQGNSKGDLARALAEAHAALQWYAKEENWAVKEDDILWLGDDDPTSIANRLLQPNKRKEVKRNGKLQPERGGTGPQGVVVSDESRA